MSPAANQSVAHAAAAGPTALERFIAAVEAAGGAKAVAARLGYSRSYIDMLKADQRRPGMRAAFRIEREFGIPMQAWVTGEPQRADESA